MLEMRPVKSPSLAKVGYDKATRVLGVEFRSGAVHHYAAVPPNVYDAMMASPRIGRFFQAFVRDVYKSEKASA